MLCYSCNKSKHQLHPVESKILSGTTLFMCQSCIDEKFEPRWVIIMAGRQFGSDKVREYITKRRYVGNEIYANELIV
jgi:hypothetical protein